MPVRYILSSVWVTLSIFSQLSIIQYVGLCVFSLPIYLVMIERIYILCLIIIIKSEVWTITHCLGLGHETMVSAVCLSIFLLWCIVLIWNLIGSMDTNFSEGWMKIPKFYWIIFLPNAVCKMSAILFRPQCETRQNSTLSLKSMLPSPHLTLIVSFWFENITWILILKHHNSMNVAIDTHNYYSKTQYFPHSSQSQFLFNEARTNTANFERNPGKIVYCNSRMLCIKCATWISWKITARVGGVFVNSMHGLSEVSVEFRGRNTLS